jgi:hypothetical protein
MDNIEHNSVAEESPYNYLKELRVAQEEKFAEIVEALIDENRKLLYIENLIKELFSLCFIPGTLNSWYSYMKDTFIKFEILHKSIYQKNKNEYNQIWEGFIYIYKRNKILKKNLKEYYSNRLQCIDTNLAETEPKSTKQRIEMGIKCFNEIYNEILHFIFISSHHLTINTSKPISDEKILNYIDTSFHSNYSNINKFKAELSYNILNLNEAEVRLSYIYGLLSRLKTISLYDIASNEDKFIKYENDLKDELYNLSENGKIHLTPYLEINRKSNPTMYAGCSFLEDEIHIKYKRNVFEYLSVFLIKQVSDLLKEQIELNQPKQRENQELKGNKYLSFNRIIQEINHLKNIDPFTCIDNINSFKFDSQKTIC